MTEEAIELYLDGRPVSVPRELVRTLAAAAAARAGVSARHRDLSLLLGRALETGQTRLAQAEVRALCAVLEEGQPERLGPAADELLRAVA
jgi:hypothetical protein